MSLADWSSRADYLPTTNNLTFSIIVVAHDRKEYLLSNLTQITSMIKNFSGLAEIIVVTNYSDEEIDEFIAKHNIKSVRIEGQSSVCWKYSTGIKMSSSDLLFFMDDDDIYEKERISVVLDLFSRYRNLDYYQNSHSCIDVNGLTVSCPERINRTKSLLIDRKKATKSFSTLLKVQPNFNMSSIVIRKEIVLKHLDLFCKLERADDEFLFYCSIVFGSNMYLDKRKLTRVRIHDSLSRAVGNYGQFINKMKMLREEELEDFKKISSYFTSFSKIHYFYTGILEKELLLNLVTETKKRRITVYLVARYCIESLKFGKAPSYALVLFNIIKIVSSRIASKTYFKLKSNSL